MLCSYLIRTKLDTLTGNFWKRKNKYSSGQNLLLPSFRNEICFCRLSLQQQIKKKRGKAYNHFQDISLIQQPEWRWACPLPQMFFRITNRREEGRAEICTPLTQMLDNRFYNKINKVLRRFCLWKLKTAGREVDFANIQQVAP